MVQAHPLDTGPDLTGDPAALIKHQQCEKVEACSTFTHKSMSLNKHYSLVIVLPFFHLWKPCYPSTPPTIIVIICASVPQRAEPRQHLHLFSDSLIIVED